MKSNGINGFTPLTYRDIWYWLDISERSLEIWEKDCILSMSKEFVSYYNKGSTKESKYAQLPYIPEDQSEALQEILNTEANDALKAFFEE